MQSQETDSCTYGKLQYDRVDVTIQCKMNVLAHKICWENCLSTLKFRHQLWACCSILGHLPSTGEPPNPILPPKQMPISHIIHKTKSRENK